MVPEPERREADSRMVIVGAWGVGDAEVEGTGGREERVYVT